VTGHRFSDLVATELAEPLALDGLYVGAPDEVHHLAADLMWPPAADWLRRLPQGAMPEWLGRLAASGAEGARRLIGLAGFELDLESLRDALAPRGISTFEFDSGDTLRATIPAANGLFTARSLARMYAALAGGGEIDGVRLLSPETLARATERQSATQRNVVIPFDMRWRLGYHGVGTTRGVPRQAFGHFGFGGSGAWADPSRELALAFIVNCGMGTPFGDTRTARISGAALASVQGMRHSRRRAAERSDTRLRPVAQA
jgi:CubicO group peptidase (beta-lactamase class C family)